ncbi:MAG: pyruvate, phosphate dikinase [Elusimicrobiaceae bacterium]|nr:pyruvate, phosphate dikinase [Elusimicrobiaceae bacterium]
MPTAVKNTTKAAVRKTTKKTISKSVYYFGNGKADGNGSMKELLGGKGANLAEMAGQLKLPVPPGFTITTEVCTYYWANKRTYPASLAKTVAENLKMVEKNVGRVFGDAKKPLLVSVRSGARSSMPGMMETILNVGLTTETIPGMIADTRNERFVYDAYRRLIMMYADVVMEKAAGIEPKDDKGIRKVLDEKLAQIKKARGYKTDTELTSEELRKLCADFKATVKTVLKKEFPDNANDQLWGAIGAVFASWNGTRAIAYRNIEKIPHEWGTAVNVQSMVFGNTGETSATGVAFTRDPGTGNNNFYGEYLVNAQGEDVVAGIRTPAPINEYSRNDQSRHLETLHEIMPKVYRELDGIQKKLEKHYHDMLDIEFTIQDGKLWMLQCRVGKRNGRAAVKMATDMFNSKMIDARTAVMRVTPAQLDELLHPVLDPVAEKAAKVVAKGLPAGPGGAAGQVVFNAADAIAYFNAGKKCILVREETNPEDVTGMRAAEAILTARGGMTSHAALVARGWGKCCIVGCAEMHIENKVITVNGVTIREGDWISLNGSKGHVYVGKLDMMAAGANDKTLLDFLKICDRVRTLKIRTNADTPEDSAKAREFGAEGIGLFRIEHMFYGKGSDDALFNLRKMIVSSSLDERKAALKDLFPFMKSDIKKTLKAMAGYPVTIRMIDPPLHEFVPHNADNLKKLAEALRISYADLEKRAEGLRENNPMMGHRGVRLGITYPEVTETQVRAIFEATAELLKEKVTVLPEIMIPVTCTHVEIENQKVIIKRVYEEVLKATGMKKIPHMVGTMIEIPRAALTADEMAGPAEFFSFGTNDLTQMSFGFSRDDIGSFLGDYLNRNILPEDPFQSIDEKGVGELIRIAVRKGRTARPNLKVGICGEHGGDPRSVEFCHQQGFNYVSCSPFRVPIARLAAAQAVVKHGGKK